MSSSSNSKNSDEPILVKKPNKKTVQDIVNADSKQVAKVAFDYLMDQLSECDDGAETTRQIVALEGELRALGSSIYCVARTAEPPTRCARTHRNEKRTYYLQLAQSIDARDKLFESEKIANETENAERLADCGILVRDRHEENKTAAHLKLPVDLNCEKSEFYVDNSAVALFVSAVDSAEARERIEKHAADSRADVIGDNLCGTSIEVLRTAVPLEKWTETQALFRANIASRQPFAQRHVVASIYYDVIPIGYQALGTTKQDAKNTTNPSKEESVDDTPLSMLIDIYAWSTPRFYVCASEELRSAIESVGDSVSDALRHDLAVLAGVADSEMAEIQCAADIERSFVFSSETS